MKRPLSFSFTIATLAVVATFASLYTVLLRFSDREVQVAVPVSAVEKTPPSAITKPGLPDGLFESRLKTNERLSIPGSLPAPSIACLVYMSDMQRLNLEPLKFPPEALKLPKATGCRALPDEQLAKLSKNAQKECVALSKDVTAGNVAADKDQWSKQSFGCLFNMILLRSTIATWQSRDQKLETITDQKLLTDRLVAAFGTIMGNDKPDPSTLITTGERIMAVNPHSYEGLKGAIIGHSIAAMTDPSYLQEEARVTRLQELADTAARLRPEDDGHQGIREIIATRGFNPQAALPVMEAAVARNPHDPRTQWGLAWALYKTGAGVDRARPHLEQALALDPTNENYRQTLQLLRRGHPGPDAFKGSVTLGLSLDNLF